MNWIKVKDRLPEEGQMVIYYFGFCGVQRGKYLKWIVEEGNVVNVFYNEKGYLGDDVEYWMPDREGELPEPPEAQ